MVAGWTSRDVLMLGAALLAVAGAQELLARWKARKSRAKPLLPRLAIIVVTSPAPCHPSTRMLECLLDSFARVQGLLEGGRVPITIVCDGVKVRASDKLKRGMCTPELELRYREYIRALRAIIAKGDRPWCAQTDIVEMPGREGFGYAVRQGLLYRKSQYVMVVQHDRPFARGFDLSGLLDAMDAEPQTVKYVCLPTSSTHAHPEMMMARHKLRLPAARAAGRISLAPMAFWYDSTHVVARDYYLKHVFGFGRAVGKVRRGQFPEECLGTAMMADICARGFSRHADYGTWVFVDGLAPAGTCPEKKAVTRKARRMMFEEGWEVLRQANEAGEDAHVLAANDGADALEQPGLAACAEPSPHASSAAFVPVVIHTDGRGERWMDEFRERNERSSKYQGLFAQPPPSAVLAREELLPAA